MGNSTFKKWLNGNSAKIIILFIIAVGALCLLLANLGNQFLWQDEAQTALISKTILTHGFPLGYDGKNYFSQEGGAEYGSNYLWRWHTWLPFYVLAGFYKIFGVTTFVSRLPFVLFGFGTVLLIYFFAKSLWPKTFIPTIAAGLLALSVPFLILSRQCRYYSMSMFFSVLALYAYFALLNRKSHSALMLFAASTLLFHTQHFYIVTLFSAIIIHALFFDRNILKKLLTVIAAVVLLNGPWLIWLSAAHIHPQANLKYVFGNALAFSLDLSRYIFPIWLFGILLAVFIFRRMKNGYFFENGGSWRNLSLPVFFVFCNILTLSILSDVPYFRYIAPSIPLLILLIAVIVNAAGKIHMLFAVLTIGLLLATGQIRDYFYEITHDFDGPCKGIVRYLNENASPDDAVAITYGDMVLKFYTNMRIVGGLTGEPMEPAKDARWVIIRKYIHLPLDEKVKDYLIKNIDWSKYRKIIINYPDTPWENRESPNAHLFRTNTNEDKVVIYEKVK